MTFLALVLLPVLLMGCQAGSVVLPAVPDSLADSVIAITHVTVLPVDPDTALSDYTVVIRNGFIAELGPASTTAVPAAASVIDGSGRYLAPGLIDAHVHARRADLPAYLHSGILTVRNMWGHSGIPGIIRDIGNGTLAGPTIISTSPGLDGSPPSWPETQLVLDAASADGVVAAQQAAGWHVIKVYQRLSAAAFAAIAASAHSRGLQIAGHVPSAVPIHDALAAGMLSIEHLTGYDVAVSRTHRSGTWGWMDADTTRFAALASATAAAGTWNCPTLAIYRAIAQRQHSSDERARIVAARRAFVGALHRAGARIVAGTDAGIDIVPAGSTLVDEIEELHASGLSTSEALRAATLDPAQLLGRGDLGHVAPGASAELVLLDGNPLVDLGALRRVAGILHRGVWSRP